MGFIENFTRRYHSCQGMYLKNEEHKLEPAGKNLEQSLSKAGRSRSKAG
jgi:hypothetical protein